MPNLNWVTLKLLQQTAQVHRKFCRQLSRTKNSWPYLAYHHFRKTDLVVDKNVSYVIIHFNKNQGQAKNKLEDQTSKIKNVKNHNKKIKNK